MIASTFVAAAVVLSIPAPSNAAAPADIVKKSVVKPGKPAIDWYTPTRIDWY